MLHPDLYHSSVVEIAPVTISPSQYEHDLFGLRFVVNKDGTWRYFPMVHIEKSVQAFFDEGRVTAIELQQLVLNGPVARSLAGHPTYVLLGVGLKDGTKISCIPPACASVARVLFLKSFFCALIAGTLALTPAKWFGGAFAVGSLRYLQEALRTPRKPTRLAQD